MEEKAMVLFSGGVDSTTCLSLAAERFGWENVIPLTVRYGQKHEKETQAARNILEHFHLKGMEIDLTPVFAYSDCPLLSHSEKDIPKGSYAGQLSRTDGSPVSTYVPFRNGLFLSAAASIALSKGCSYLYYGAHRDDVAGNAYPDCSVDFFNSMNQAVYEGSGKALRLVAPFINSCKADIVRQGLRLNTPYELTWSCYEGGDKPCGRCATCLDRKKAFAANGVEDPADLS